MQQDKVRDIIVLKQFFQRASEKREINNEKK